VSGSLQRNGKRGVGQRVARRQSSQRQCCTNRLVKLAGIAQGANETVVRLNMRIGVLLRGSDGPAKGLCGFAWLPGNKQVMAAQAQRFGGERVGCGHGSL